jgi:hypothetical protein
MVLKKIDNTLNDLLNLPLITIQLNKMFSWSNKITNKNFKDIEIYIYNTLKDNKQLQMIQNQIQQTKINIQTEFNKQINILNTTTNDFKFDDNNFIKVKLSDIFEIIKGQTIKISDCKQGQYNVIGSSSSNNGIVSSNDTYIFECSEQNPLYTLSKNGSVGYIFKQTNNFITTQDIMVLKKIDNTLNDLLNLPLITIQLNKMFSWSNKITNKNFKGIEIYIYNINKQ